MYSLGFKDKKKTAPIRERSFYYFLINDTTASPLGHGHDEYYGAGCVPSFPYEKEQPYLAFARLVPRARQSPPFGGQLVERQAAALTSAPLLMFVSCNKSGRLVLICVHLNIEKFPMNRYAHYLH